MASAGRGGRVAGTAYRHAEIGTLTQRDLVVRLYRGLEVFLEQARQAMAERVPTVAHDRCQRAKDVVVELLSTLDFSRGGEVAAQLKQFYLWLLLRISEANLRKDGGIVEGVLSLLVRVREAWEQIPAAEANTSALANAGASSAVDMRS